MSDGAASGQAVAPGPILDALVHVTPGGRWFDTAYDASEDRLLREMDTAEVERAVVVPLAGYISNEFVDDLCRRHPSRLVAGAGFDPAAHDGATSAGVAVRVELAGAGCRVLKLHPRLHRYDVLDSRCLGVLEEVASWPSPPAIWMDTLIHYRGGTPSAPLVDAFHSLVGRFPMLTFVLLHAGGPWALQLATAVRDCPRVFLDLSFSIQRYRRSSLWLDLRCLVETFDRRLLFGSDFPEVGIAAALSDFREMSAGLDPERCGRILGRNLQDLLELRP